MARGQAEVLEVVTSPAVHGGSLGWGSGCGDAVTSGDVQSVLEVELLTLWVGWTGGRRSGESHAAVPSGQGGWVSGRVLC